jgi:hypothetical protein
MRMIYCDICKIEFEEEADNDWLNERMKEVFGVQDICNKCFDDFFLIVRRFREEKSTTSKSEGKTKDDKR